jgi:hypothetical protein
MTVPGTPGTGRGAGVNVETKDQFRKMGEVEKAGDEKQDQFKITHPHDWSSTCNQWDVNQEQMLYIFLS